MRLKTVVTDNTGITYGSENQPFSKDYYYGCDCIDLDKAKDHIKSSASAYSG